ncbi:Maf family protein [Pseudomonas sp. KNUC1026]|uniref:Maf family protein n=1 Tax=Pseudomonas sp. KNUC1026 TaxID=2893890 RepID=UPI001F2A348E|nr:nucleoside triphosphate pyrophosphatase [Pseudomonas sp. KNUC1026]UFH48501.1 Maf family nucleotide pyrophosphatase [Pseudomonas sp. KNUC1026]
MPPIVLASSSPYRRELLNRLGLPFSCRSPDIDESRLPDEPVLALALRLAEAKARALAASHPHHLIIGSDQVAVLDERILGKPGSHAAATEQLLACSGQAVRFLTGLALLDSRSGECQVDCVAFTVHLRALDAATVERYLRAEQPYDCAGSFKAEGLGVSLFSRTEGEDLTSLVGLPLIRLVGMLAQHGIQVP